MPAIGTSMLPLVKNPGSTLYIEKLSSEPEIGDIILYIRPDARDTHSYVLHRVVGKNADGLILCGDNQYRCEYGVKLCCVAGIARGMYAQDGEYTDFAADEKYKAYVKAWCSRSMPRRMAELRLRGLCRKFGIKYTTTGEAFWK